MRLSAGQAKAEPVRITRNGKRFFSEARKRAVVEECLRPGASVSGVALAHGFNANLVRKWIGKYQRQRTGALVPVGVVDVAPPSGRRSRRATPVDACVFAGSIEIELGAARVCVRGQVEAEQIRVVLHSLSAAR